VDVSNKWITQEMGLRMQCPYSNYVQISIYCANMAITDFFFPALNVKLDHLVHLSTFISHNYVCGVIQLHTEVVKKTNSLPSLTLPDRQHTGLKELHILAFQSAGNPALLTLLM